MASSIRKHRSPDGQWRRCNTSLEKCKYGANAPHLTGRSENLKQKIEEWEKEHAGDDAFTVIKSSEPISNVIAENSSMEEIVSEIKKNPGQDNKLVAKHRLPNGEWVECPGKVRCEYKLSNAQILHVQTHNNAKDTLDDKITRLEKRIAKGEIPEEFLDGRIKPSGNGKGKSNTSIPAQRADRKVQTHLDGLALSKNELKKSAARMSDLISNEEYKVIKDFIDKYEEMSRRSAESIAEFLNSDDEVAKKTKAFIGEPPSSEDFADLLANNVRSMTKSLPFANSGATIPRYVMSRMNNDMNKTRYIASVLYFGGRCCYCNTVMNRISGSESQATGEHLTPLSGEGEPPKWGGTRFGNVVLACKKCNTSRMSMNLEDFINTTDRIPDDQRKHCLDRINAFREFALYEEYSDEQNKEISKVIDNLVKVFKESDSTEDFKKLLYDDAAKLHERINSI